MLRRTRTEFDTTSVTLTFELVVVSNFDKGHGS